MIRGVAMVGGCLEGLLALSSCLSLVICYCLMHGNIIGKQVSQQH